MLKRTSIRCRLHGFPQERTAGQSVAFMLKCAFWSLFLCLIIISFPLSSLAVTAQDIPNPRQVYGGWVTDMANILSDNTESQLNQIISEMV